MNGDCEPCQKVKGRVKDSLLSILERTEKETIRRCLRENRWDRDLCAKILHISAEALVYKMKKYKLER